MRIDWKDNDKGNLPIAAARIASLGIQPLAGQRQEDRSDGLLVLQHQQAGDAAGTEKEFA